MDCMEILTTLKKEKSGDVLIRTFQAHNFRIFEENPQTVSFATQIKRGDTLQEIIKHFPIRGPSGHWEPAHYWSRASLWHITVVMAEIGCNPIPGLSDEALEAPKLELTHEVI
jgi:hypothetical protein